ncbi:MAG: hypothetical protein HGA51_01430, partial [Demequinaceae bacterium]|nr:hypothetical protein [Demequinaceae bacterium]
MVEPSLGSPHRLVIYLAALGQCTSMAEAMRVGASAAAEELDAEIGVVIEGDRVKAAFGFGQDPVPANALIAIPLGTGVADLRGLGVCHTMAASWSWGRTGRLVVVRMGAPFGSQDRDLLLGMAGGFGMAVESIRALEQGRVQLRTLEVLLEIQRSISRHSPLPTILQAVTDGASSVLGGCPVSLLLDNARDLE